MTMSRGSPHASSYGVSLTRNGPPPDAAAVVYVGNVMHQRMKPFGHRFQYRVFSLSIDLDRLEEANGQSALFSVNRSNLVSFHEEDHAADGKLRSHADRLLAGACVERPAKILLVCYPRIFGYVFNPLSVYYAYDDRDALIALIYEVRNTFGERHSYVCPVEENEIFESGLRQTCDKLFYVSPFIGIGMRYHFRMLPPGQEIRWRILETDAEGPLLAATFAGRKRSLTGRTLGYLLAAIPFLTIKIMAGIHWEALKLWLKGAIYVRRPPPPPPVSVKSASRLAEAAE
ncbi:DUF1365 domain-containing protein [Rhizobium sp. CF142]|uniref:DUF1365 domain-containing protein n=1 Tax=Rhizobium sp. CF142 TaxID=1144314 RepID=UPI00026EFB0C|nr:DUF1365 domain-containing protein [Rhizobium sp. CF142]EJJ29982.1 hypothetical protein PMI11_01766 [Rhizobium sp. CF142]